MGKKALHSLILILFTGILSAQKIDMSLLSGIRPRNIGPGGMSGRVTAFAVDPRNENVFYVGTASGGLWKTVNAGTTFTPIFDGEEVASIGALAVDPLHPDVIWAGTGEGNPRNSVTGGYGIYKSCDGGRTWKCMGLELTRFIHRIVIDPVNPDIVFAGAIGNPWAPHRERGLYRTKDGGKTWEQLLFTSETTGVADMVMDPTNPRKLFVAMWDHRRWPWFFTSSPEGSALWVTTDGGDTFSKVTDGLPQTIGRIGLAIAGSRPDYVYAYVESNPSAIYRSVDGGAHWERRGEKNIGNRPFYYAEIYVDPKNENRVYTLFSGVNVSEDGGLTFDKRTASSVHLDHHAWFIDRTNPDRMLDGNDGGMAITYDKGETWRHIENLPLGQFYHINVDNETPYNIYGGLQDNGSWKGPAYAWYNGPLINEMFDFLLGGDGFDAMPVAGDTRYCYAQSQGGSLRRFDTQTGWSTNIRPAAGENERLRFNWNSALAQDPFDKNTIYFGSQFVHKSTDRGDTWTKISPDLTSNDPEKQKQDKSGGLTTEATGAENHCTIVTISPSPVKKGIIWAGTDDGRVQVTTDDGIKWDNVTGNIKGLPRNCWIPQITASVYDPAVAWVVANDYRQGDNAAYLFRTENYGKSWTRVIDDSDVWGYMLCFVQDPVVPQLLFAGTEYGLYVSFDGGETWNKWTKGYPTVSTYDMVIQPREGDLVIGTFGRGIWIIDDLTPLRAIAKEGKSLLEKKIVVFDAPEAIMAATKNLPGYYFYGDAMFKGENRQTGSMITVFLSDKEGTVSMNISDESGKVVKSADINLQRGFNRVIWRFDRNPLPSAGISVQGEDQRGRYFRNFGGPALPGRYIASFKNGEETATAGLITRYDPRLPEPDINALKGNRERAERIASGINTLNANLSSIREMKDQYAKCDALISKQPDFAKEISDIHKSVKEELAKLETSMNSRPSGLLAKINSYRVLEMATGHLSAAEERTVIDAEKALAEATRLTGNFINNTWPAYKKALEKISITGDIILNL